jgi:DEAD/DEAH box helicase domain-containing protein
MAVSAFAPGAQVVRDGVLHVAAGFAAYDIKGHRADAKDPLGQALQVGRCLDCGAMLIRPSGDACESCQGPLTKFEMFQPLGFRTTYNAKDYNDENEFSPGAALPVVALATPPTRDEDVAAIRLRTFEQAEVVQVNDNRAALFPLRTLTDGSVIVPDPSRYPPNTWHIPNGTDLEPAAIGEVRTTDVLLVELTGVDVPGGVVPSTPQQLPAGKAAFWSFAEAIRTACQVQLDVDPQELVVGLQAVRRHDSPTFDIFVADALENGAGYAAEIGHAGVFKALLSSTRQLLDEQWGSSEHQICTSSCPDCLRSYDNRRLHGALDWRLALDMLALAAGETPPLARWLERGMNLTDGLLADGYELGLKRHVLDDMPVLMNESDGRALAIGHPLWRREPHLLTEAQREIEKRAADELNPSSIQWTDAYELDRRPLAVLRRVLG